MNRYIHKQSIMVASIFHTTKGENMMTEKLDMLRDAVRQAEERELEALADLDNAVAKLQAFAWRAIETAPRDCEILLYRPGKRPGSGNVSTGSWETNEYARHPSPYWGSLSSRSVRLDRDFPPSHWMPIPAPPTEEVAG